MYEYAKSHPFGLDILILLETGISRSELLGLLFENYDSEESVIHIVQGLVMQKNTKTDKHQLISDGLKNQYRERIIPISEYLSQRIKDAHAQTASSLIVHSTTGEYLDPMNWYKRRYKPFMMDMHQYYATREARNEGKNIDIPMLNPHELRHPYVKHTTKNIFLQKQKSQAINRF